MAFADSSVYRCIGDFTDINLKFHSILHSRMFQLLTALSLIPHWINFDGISNFIYVVVFHNI